MGHLRLSVLCVFAALAGGCTGHTLGENAPGEDVYLEGGSIAVDTATETSFVMQQEGAGGAVAKTLFAIDPDDGEVETVADLSGLEDLRILFPRDHVLVMGERDGSDEIHFLARDTWEEQGVYPSAARYHGTRMSPSRRFVAVADNDRDDAPIHVIDTSQLHVEVVPHGGDWLEAMWANESDRLVAIVFYDQYTPDARARVLVWDVGEVAGNGYATNGDGLWPNAVFDIEVPDVSGDILGSFTWVGISPDDTYAVFPVTYGFDGENPGYELIQVNLVTGEVRTVDDARGPVGFTPDGSTIVSYRYVGEDAEPWLLFIDAETLEVDPMAIPWSDGPQYFVTREGNFVVVASSVGGEQVLLFDVDERTMTRLQGPGIDLHEFVSRTGHGELWLVDEGLYRLDLEDARLDDVPLRWTPQHINVLPARDRLVLDDPASNTIRFFNPETRRVTLRAELPSE